MRLYCGRWCHALRRVPALNTGAVGTARQEPFQVNSVPDWALPDADAQLSH